MKKAAVDAQCHLIVAQGVYSAQGPTFDFEMRALQAGPDIYRREDDQGRRDRAGAYFAVGRVDGAVTHIGERGRLGSDRPSKPSTATPMPGP